MRQCRLYVMVWKAGLGRGRNDKMSTRQVGNSFRSGMASDLQGLFCLAAEAADIGSRVGSLVCGRRLEKDALELSLEESVLR